MECYKSIKGWPDYEVSDSGNIRNKITGDLVKLNENQGYKLVSLKNKNGRKRKRVHILVAQAFNENPFNKPIVDHINSNRSDNRKENLRWATSIENNANQKLRKNNTSGFKGIGFNKENEKWFVSFPYKKLGVKYYKEYDNIDEAIIDRVCKVNKLYGEFVHNDELFLFISSVIKVYKKYCSKYTKNN
jgi:hypothetical protein